MHVVVVGNGIAGVTTARTLRRLQPEWRITIVSGESRYHYSRPALMYVFMGHLTYAETKPHPDHLWAAERIELRRAWVTGIDAEARTLRLHEQEPLAYDRLVLALGSTPNRFGWPGQDLPGVQGLYSLMDLHQLYENVRGARRAVIVGGGLIGVELAEMLLSRRLEVTFLVREASYWGNVLPPEESALIGELIRRHGVDLRLETELEEIEAGPSGRVAAVRTRAGERIECELVGLTAGVSPNLAACAESEVETGRGVLVDERLQTNIPEVYAVGDCAEIRRPGQERNLLQQVWYTGKLQGEFLARVLAEVAPPEETYDPGLWFNSAKFFDLEYQTYGFVHPRPQEGETHHWWRAGDLGLRIVTRAGAVTGFNALGLRLRHTLCEEWIQRERSLDYVLEHLAAANFDPELYRRHEPAIRAALLQSAPEGH